MSEIMETCYLCDAPLKDGKFICNHSPGQKEAGNMLMDIEFCDHFCCEKPPNLCRATKLAELLKTHLVSSEVATLLEGRFGVSSVTGETDVEWLTGQLNKLLSHKRSDPVSEAK